MNSYQVLNMETTAIVLRFREKGDGLARARARRQCEPLRQSQGPRLELCRYVKEKGTVTTWAKLGPVYKEETTR